MTGPSVLKVALVGCGQIADAHLREILEIPSARLVAVCDRHADLARQASARFGSPQAFDDLGAMLAGCSPDVLHVTTPPQTHRPIAIQALEAGAHVFVEKPFALDVAEADKILGAARSTGRLVCVGHDQLYDPVWLECRQLVDAGSLGRIVHVESMQGYDLRGPFGRSLVEDPDHWVRRLPGGLFQNVMSHALYRITDLLPDEYPSVWATWFGDEAARGLPTELRVSLIGLETTANLTFTSLARPVQRMTRIFGTRAGIEVNPDARVIRSFLQPRLPGALGKVEMPIRHWGEATRSSLRNIKRFLRSELHYFAGMRTLFAAFYESILEGSEAPIPPGEIRRVTDLMDRIFASCRAVREGRMAQGVPDRPDLAGLAPGGPS